MAFKRDKQGGGGFKRDKQQAAESEGLLFQIPGIGPYLKSADAAVSSVIGRPPQGTENIQGLRDLARTGASALDLGASDYALGPAEQKKTEEAKARLGKAAIIPEVVGGYFTPGPAAPVKWGKLAKTALESGTAGTQSIIDAWTHGERDPWDLATAGATGAGITGAASAVADPIASWWSKSKQAKALPPAEDVKAEGRAGYKAVKDLGGAYHRDDVRSLLAEFEQMPRSPQVDVMRQWLDKNWRGQDIPPDKLDQMRRIIRKKAGRMDVGDQFTSEQFVKSMDKFAENTPVTSSTGADIPGVNDTLKAARSRYHDYFRSKEVEKAAPRKEGLLNVFGESSEAPSVNRFKKLDTRGYPRAEKEAVESLGKPGKVRSAGEIARKISPFRSPLGPVLGGIGTVASAFSPAGILPAVGGAAIEGVSALGKAATKAEIDNLQSLIKTGKGITADPAAVARARDAAARLAASLTRTGYNQFGGPR